MEEHVLTKVSDEVDKISNMQELKLINSDGGDLANHSTTDEVILFDGVICVWILKSEFTSFDVGICNTRWFTRMGSYSCVWSWVCDCDT